MSFYDLLDAAYQRSGSLICVGLDPDPARIPAALQSAPDPVYAFCAALIEATADLACVFKPNSAFFEALGSGGMQTLRRVIAAVPPGVPVLLDAKRGDIGSTAEAYARAAFAYLGAHAITLSPYLGGDGLEPFLRDPERGCFVLCKTSNPGSADLQNLPLSDGRPLYMEVARRAQAEWNGRRNVGLVVGATHPAELAAVRAQCPDMPLLVPGVGAQGGDLATAVRAGADARGAGMLINVSRSVMYASSGADFAEAARAEVARLRAEALSALGAGPYAA